MLPLRPLQHSQPRQQPDLNQPLKACIEPQAMSTSPSPANSSELPIAILDAGAQYGKVIDRRVRELNVESVMLPLSTPATSLKDRYKAIIISGGPSSVNSADASAFDPNVFHLGVPVLGICYGFQLIHKHFGGDVERLHIREDGQTSVEVDTTCSLFNGLSAQETVLLTHGDSVRNACPGFEVVAKSGQLVAAMSNEQMRIFGVQFHPEVDLTTNGKQILSNFLVRISNCSPTFTIASREQTCIDEIQSLVRPDQQVLVMVSGGVDSTVCAALLHRALKPEQIIAVHIDNGFMRKNETSQVMTALTRLGLKPKVFHGTTTFATSTAQQLDRRTGITRTTEPLNQTTDPEVKRLIIGDTFMAVKDLVLRDLKLDETRILLAQGTLRPDLIESASELASAHADTIKTHHNDTPMVRSLRKQGKVIEPLRDFHKDEVRRLGKDLHLEDAIVDRHPFPGPGLAIRILCANEPYMCQDFRYTSHLLDAISRFSDISKRESGGGEYVSFIRECLHGSQDLQRLEQVTANIEVYASLLPLRTVGVQGDARSYSYVAALSTDSDSKPIPWTDMFFLAKLIPSVLKSVNRVCYVFGPATEEYMNDVTPTLLNEYTVAQAQEADFWATQVLHNSGCMYKVQQMPVVLLPVHFDRSFDGITQSRPPSVMRSVCIRPFITHDFMTGRPAVPGVDLPEQVVLDMAKSIKSNVALISRVMYDMTAKPPATTEWE